MSGPSSTNDGNKNDKHIKAIFEKLGKDAIISIYKSMGFRPVKEVGGYLQGHAIGREDKKMSASICLQRYFYRDFSGGTFHLCSMMMQHCGHPNYQSARLRLAKMAGYEGLGSRDKEGAITYLDKSDQERILSLFLEAKKPVTKKSLDANGVSLANRHGKGGKRKTVIMVPCVDRYQNCVGHAIYYVSFEEEKKFASMICDKPDKKKTGFLGLAGVRAIKDAKMVFKVEGVTDVLALYSILPNTRDYAVVSNLNGCAERPTEEHEAMLAGKDVVIIGDSDKPGREGAEMWAQYICHTARMVKVFSLGYEEKDARGKDIRDWINDGNTFDDLLEAVEITERVNPLHSRLQKEITAGYNSHDLVHLVRNHVIKSNHPPDIFSYGGKLCYVSSGKVHQHTKHTMVHTISKHVDFYIDAGDTRIDKEPPPSIVNGILDYDGNKGFPKLTGLTALPIVRQDGSIVNGSGYDEESGRLHVGALDCQPGQKPTRGDALKAAGTFRELISESTFADGPSEANTIAMILTGLLYSYFAAHSQFDSPAPMFVITAAQSGTGKSELAKLACMLGFGSCDPISLADRDEEVQKQIVTELATGKGYMFFDNLGRGRKTNSNSIATAATTKWLTGRGAYMRQVTVNTDSLWVMTGNNVQIADDFQRRVVLIRMTSPMANPGDVKREREGYFLEWACSRRGIYAAAAIDWLRAWIDAGKPSGTSGGNLMGYSHWSTTIAGMLTFAGVEGLDENREEIAESDLEEQSWQGLFDKWYEFYQHRENCEIFIGDLFDPDGVIEAIQDDPGMELPKELVDAIAKKDGPRALGSLMWNKYRDRVVVISDEKCDVFPTNKNSEQKNQGRVVVRIQRINRRNTHKSAARWGLIKIKNDASSDGIPF